MPYRILTYTNPYEISKTAYWNEIKDLPHFCVARTLVNGLVDVMQDSIGGLICPLDDLVKHKYVYKEWEDNISRRIEQYSFLTKLFSAAKAKSNGAHTEDFFAKKGLSQSCAGFPTPHALGMRTLQRSIHSCPLRIDWRFT